MHILKYHTIGIHRLEPKSSQPNQVLSTIWASTFPHHNNSH